MYEQDVKTSDWNKKCLNTMCNLRTRINFMEQSPSAFQISQPDQLGVFQSEMVRLVPTEVTLQVQNIDEISYK